MMVTTVEQKQEASRLRKEQNFEAALPLYRDLWVDKHDKYDGVGLLCCLRKLALFNEAIPLARELIDQYSEFEWCSREVAWTYIHGIIDRYDAKEPFERILEIAEEIIKVSSDALIHKSLILRIMKLASHARKWKIVNEWAIKIDPDSLNTEPTIIDESCRQGWSEQAQWYNYRIKGLINSGISDQIEEAIVLTDHVLRKCPKQLQKFFKRYKALAKHRLGDLQDAEKLYGELCEIDNTEWWLLYDYARLLIDLNRDKDALKLMCRAARHCRTLKTMISLLMDLGETYLRLKKYDAARCHFLLCKYIRETEAWPIPQKLLDYINNKSSVIGIECNPESLKEALKLCEKQWTIILGEDRNSPPTMSNKRKTRFGLKGTVVIGLNEQIFCFIAVNGEKSIYCQKSALPINTVDGQTVTFDAQPSFDKKKNQESWKAVNVKRCNQA